MRAGSSVSILVAIGRVRRLDPTPFSLAVSESRRLEWRRKTSGDPPSAPTLHARRRDVSPERKNRPARGVNTRAVHGPSRDVAGPMSTPIVHSSTFSFENLDAMLDQKKLGPAGSFYQREGHPTLHACERRIAMLEGAPEALLFASGMAALSSLFLSQLRPGDHVVAIDQCYGGTHSLLEWG